MHRGWDRRRVRMAIRCRDLPGAPAHSAESPATFAPRWVRELTRTVGRRSARTRCGFERLVPIEQHPALRPAAPGRLGESDPQPPRVALPRPDVQEVPPGGHTCIGDLEYIAHVSDVKALGLVGVENAVRVLPQLVSLAARVDVVGPQRPVRISRGWPGRVEPVMLE